MKKSYGTFSTDVGTDQQLFFYSFAKKQDIRQQSYKVVNNNSM